MQVTQDHLCPDPKASRGAARLGAWALWSGVAGFLLVLVPLAFMPALILGHVMRVRYPKSEPAFRKDRRCALIGLVFGYTAAVIQAAALLAVVFSPLLAHNYTRLRFPPNTRILLALEVTGQELPQDAIVTAAGIVSQRLSAVGIPHSIETLPRDRIAVYVPVTEQWPESFYRELLGIVGWLELRLVHAGNDGLIAQLFENGRIPPGYAKAPVMHGGLFRKRSAADEAPADLSQFHVPDPAYEFMLHEVVRGRDTFHEPLYVQRRSELTSRHVEQASVSLEGMGGPVVEVQFSAEGAKRFADVTAANVGRRLAIVVDGRVQTVPIVLETIHGGRAQISGRFTVQEARVLAAALNAGVCPAPVTVLDIRPLEKPPAP